MTNFILKTGSIGLLCLASTVAMAGAKNINLDEAEQKCGKRISFFASQPFDRYGNYPDPWQVRTRYRACVYGYVKQEPVNYPDFGPEKLFDLDAFVKKQKGLG